MSEKLFVVNPQEKKFRPSPFLPLEGIGLAMAKAASKGESLEYFETLLTSKESFMYFSSLTGTTTGRSFSNIYFLLKKYLALKSLGYGIERCVYLLNPRIYCLSPLIINEQIFSLEDFLPALENIASSCEYHALFPLDAYSVAFLASRYSKLNPIYLRALNSNQTITRNLAALYIFADLQRECGGSFPNLSIWMANLCQDRLSSYRNLKRKKALQFQLKEIIMQGNLVKLGQILGDQRALNQDFIDYRLARTQALIIQSEIKSLENKILGDCKYTLRIGRETAAVLVSIVSLLFIGFYLMKYIS